MPSADFEIKYRDLAARIATLKTGHGKIETPTILPVINPNKQLIKASEMKKFGAQAIITNAYILWKDHTQEVLRKGVHDFLDFQGTIMTDSGAYQLMSYGDIEVSNKEIINFQSKIGVDIGVILDQPTMSDKQKQVAESVRITIEKAKESQSLIKKKGVLWCGPIQGNIYTSLLKKCATQLSKLDFQIHPIGSVVPLLKQYKFSPHIKIIRTVKEIVPENRPVHLFGAGHPMFFSFAVAMGVDLFDSAAYALYAKDGRYLTQHGTEKIDELSYLPCSCPICSKYNVTELKDEKLLAQHNLYVTFEELRVIKQAIKDNGLWDLLERRARAHPYLLDCMKKFTANKTFINKYDPITKKHFFYLSKFSNHKSEVSRVAQRIKKIRRQKVKVQPFGLIPASILQCYPFSQTIIPDIIELKIRKTADIDKIKDCSVYWFGINIFPSNVRIQKSKRLDKIRAVYSNKKLLATFRATDFMILLHEGAKTLHEKTKYPKYRVVVDDKEVEDYIKKGKSVFAKFVVEADKDIIPGQEVLVVNKKDKLLASGEAVLNEKEMKDFNRGVAVKVRWTNK